MSSQDTLNPETVRTINSLVEKDQLAVRSFSLGDIPLFIPVVTMGLKTGSCGEIMGSRDELERKFDELGLNTRFKEIRENAYRVHYTKNRELLDRVDFGTEGEDFGRFLGVPEQDNLWYEESYNPDIPDVKPIPEYLDLEPDDIDGLEFARLVPWICKPTIGGLYRTIDIGRKWHEVAERMSKEYGYYKALNYCKRQLARKDHSWYSFGSNY